MIRLDKLLASLGYCSRREVPAFIRKGKVLVGGQPPQSSDQKVDPESVTVDGSSLDPGTGMVVMLHKPSGYVCSSDDVGRLVFELLPPRFSNRKPPLACVGRLDKETTGLLLLTDDGALLHRLTSPRHKVPKIYEATLAEPLRGDEGEIFSSGTLMLKSETTPLKPSSLKILEPRRAQVTVTEGRYHQVRRMFAAVGNHVVTLHRLQIGSLTLRDLEEGKYRLLRHDEVELAFATKNE
jgi:16S rRNA pseudouridine516 synthase